MMQGFWVGNPNCPLCQVYLLQSCHWSDRPERLGKQRWEARGRERRNTDVAINPGTLVSRAFSFSATFLQILVTWWISELRKRFWVRYASMSSWKKARVVSGGTTNILLWRSHPRVQDGCHLWTILSLCFLICKMADMNPPFSGWESTELAGNIK